MMCLTISSKTSAVEKTFAIGIISSLSLIESIGIISSLSLIGFIGIISSLSLIGSNETA